MTFLEKLLMGGAQMCYAPADENGGGGGSDGGDADGSESDADGAENQGTGADDGTQDGGDESGDADGGDAAGDKGKKKDGTSLLDELEDGEGTTFDFSKGEKPEGFPDEYWDEDSKGPNAQALFDALQKQEKIAKDLRAKMGKGAHKPPEKPEQYTFKPSEKSAEHIKDGDPLVVAAQKVAHKHGLSQAQYEGFMADIVDNMVDMAAQMGDEASPANEEARKAYIKEQIAAIGPNGPQVLRAVQSWANEMKAEGVFSEDDVDTLVNEGLTSAKMVQMFNRLRSRMGGSSVPMDAVDDGLPPDAEIADTLNAAYESKDPAKIRKAEGLLDKRRAAGRPEKLQF